MKNPTKKIFAGIALATLLLVCTIQAEAQNGEFGFRFMPTFTALNVNTSDGNTVKGEVTLGYGIGALLGFNFSEHVGVQGEVIYSSITQKYSEMDVEHRINLRYLNIPLLLTLNTGKTKPVNLNVVAGPQIGISVGSSLFTSGDGTNNNPAVLSVKKGDLGFAYGAGVDFGLNTESTFRLGLGYRGVSGLFDISDNSNTLTTDSYYVLDRTHIKTHAIYMGLSYLF